MTVPVPSKNPQRRLRKFFTGNSIHRGHEYFHNGAVMALQIGPEGAWGEVIGSRVYEVSLAWPRQEPGFLLAYCTCPHLADGYMCKHLWALILELDRRGEPSIQILRRSIELVFDDGIRNPEPFATDGIRATPAITRNDWRQAFASVGRKPRSKKTIPMDVFVVVEPAKYEEDSVQFRFFNCERNADGVPGIPKPLNLPLNGNLPLANSDLRSALMTIATLANQDSYSYFHAHAGLAVRRLKLPLVRHLLPGLLATGRFFAKTEDFAKFQQFNENLCLKLAQFGGFKLTLSEFDGNLQLGGSIEIKQDVGPRSLAAGELELIAKPDLFRWENHLGFLNLTEAEQHWYDELATGPLTVPAEDTEACVEALFRQPLKFDLPVALDWERRVVEPSAHLELKMDRETGRDRYLAELKFQYGPRTVSYWDPGTALPSMEEKRIYVRNRTHEDQVFAKLPFVLLARDRDHIPVVRSQNLVEFVRSVLNAGLPVVVENRKVHEANDLQISVSSGVDWFDVEGEAGFSGRWVKFPAILESVNRGERFIPLPDGSMGMINDQMIHRLERIGALASKAGDHFRFAGSQGLLLNSLLEEEKNLKLDGKFEKLREKIKRFNGINPSDPAPSFKGKLRRYQREGLGWLEFLDGFGLGGILADDMGLGKTVQCLAFLDARRFRVKRARPSLLLAPKSVLQNWRSEANRFTPAMDVLVYAGSQRDGSKSLFKNFDLVVSTYQTMLRDIELLKSVEWDCVILDEAQAIKNPHALIAKAAKTIPAQFRLAMTGTPIENSLQDLFSISDFVNPGFLSGARRVTTKKLSDDTRQAVARAFKPVVLRRTKDEVLKDLPEKTEQLISVELESKQLKTYNELKRFYQSQLLRQVREKGIHKSQIQILAALTRLRQAALHPGLIDPSHANSKSAKVEAVLEMLENLIAEGHRVLIFSQFTGLLALLKVELNRRKIKFHYLDGKTVKRQEVVNEFTESGHSVFLMSLKAGGVGLNLVEANYVFLLDPWWNPAVEAQAIDRVHRIGQKRAVNAYRFIAKNTVEEKILQLQQSKRDLSAEILGQRASPLRSLTAKDIENLFE
jgi:superfamily II DNA or RNA helicase